MTNTNNKKHTTSAEGLRPGEDNAAQPANENDPTKAAPKRNPGHQVDANPAQGGPSTRRNPEAGKPQEHRKRGRH